MLEEFNLTIGEIVAPFSRFGEVKVRLDTDFPDRFSRLKQVCIRDKDGSAQMVNVETSRIHKGQALLKIKGINSINDAETLRNQFVQVRKEEAVQLPSNEFYIHDILGFAVHVLDGDVLGNLAQVLQGPVGGNDVYVVRGGTLGEVLLPVVRQVIRKVDIEAKRIWVTPMAGLLPGDEVVVPE